MFEKSEQIPGWFSLAEMFELYGRAYNSLPGPIVEIGSYLGRSTSILAQIKRDYPVYAIDLWQKTDEVDPSLSGEHYGAWAKNGSYFPEFAHNISWCGLEGIIKPICERAHVAARLFDDDSVPFIFHDASHDFDSVKRDFAAWFPKLMVGGTWCHHDYDQKGGLVLDEELSLEKINVVEHLAIFIRRA